ncbi:MAG: M15 family metallopeptidase [Myxococcales bacterium]|nr:MAG: M15 family metallopeptidase [Myxococcales bacterium]
MERFLLVFISHMANFDGLAALNRFFAFFMLLLAMASGCVQSPSDIAMDGELQKDKPKSSDKICELIQDTIGYPLSQIDSFFPFEGVQGQCAALINGAPNVTVLPLVELVALNSTEIQTTLEQQSKAACAVLQQTLSLCKEGSYQQGSEPLVTHKTSCHPNANFHCDRYHPDFAEILGNAELSFTGGLKTTEDSYCTGQVAYETGYSQQIPAQPVQWSCKGDDAETLMQAMEHTESIFAWTVWPLSNITECEESEEDSVFCNQCKVVKALLECVLPNLGPSKECTMPGPENTSGRKYQKTGDYCYRMTQLTGGLGASAHSAGLAFDLNNLSHPLANRNNGNIFSLGDQKAMNIFQTAQVDLPPEFVSILEGCGFEWGGRMNSAEGIPLGCDPMHFQLPAN